jgi:hypothetical protein
MKANRIYWCGTWDVGCHHVTMALGQAMKNGTPAQEDSEKAHPQGKLHLCLCHMTAGPCVTTQLMQSRGPNMGRQNDSMEEKPWVQTLVPPERKRAQTCCRASMVEGSWCVCVCVCVCLSVCLSLSCHSFCFSLFSLVGVGFELRASSATWATHPVHFALVILEMRSCKPFAQAGLEPQSSQSQSPK